MILYEQNREDCKTACVNEISITCKHAEFAQFNPEYGGQCLMGEVTLAEISTMAGDFGIHVYEPQEHTFTPGKHANFMLIITCNPYNAEQCPSEVWVKRGSHCHLASCNTGDMQHAREQCSSFGATVASVHDVNEELFIEWLAMSEQSIDGISCGVNGSMYLGLTSNGISKLLIGVVYHCLYNVCSLN